MSSDILEKHHKNNKMTVFFICLQFKLLIEEAVKEMRLHLCRLSLIENAQPNLDEEFSLPTRGEFLSKYLGRQFDFAAKKGTRLSFYPIQTDDKFIYGSVTRWYDETTESDPKEPFQAIDGGHWEHATFAFNLDPKQQVLGIEHNQKVGRPIAIAKNIARSIDDRSGRREYSTQAFSINSERGFWTAINEFGGTVTSLEFDLAMPNPTGVGDETKKVLEKLRKETKAENILERLSNADGMNLDSDHVRDRVKYIENGGGDVAAKSGRKSVFNSANHQKTIEVDDQFKADGQIRKDLYECLKDKLIR